MEDLDEDLNSPSESISDEETDDHKQKIPDKPTSRWAGKSFSPWWWLGSKAKTSEEVHTKETGHSDDEIIDLFHGTEIHNLPRILSEGLRPSVTGAGAGAVQAHYGMFVPGVYVTPSFQTATYYPMQPTTAKVTVQGLSLIHI